MKSDKPFRKSLVCGVVLLVVIAIILAGVSGAQNLSYRLGHLMPLCISAKEKQAGGVQSETSKKKVYDAGFEAGRAWALNYRTAADAVPKYNADPNVVAAWDKLKTTAEPMFK